MITALKLRAAFTGRSAVDFTYTVYVNTVTAVAENFSTVAVVIIPETKIIYIMSDKKGFRAGKSTWIAVGVIVFIILLFIWLTMADLWGDTDVAAFIPPMA